MRASYFSRFWFVCLLSLFNLSFAVAAPPVTTVPKPLPAKRLDSHFIANVAAAGITFQQTKDTLDMTIDEQRTMSALPGLQAGHLIPRIAPADITRAPLSIAVDVVGVAFTVVILDAIYADMPDADKVVIQGYVIPRGSKQKQLCYTFDTDRETFKKLDLRVLTPKDFMLMTPSFMFTDWCKAIMKMEGQQKRS